MIRQLIFSTLLLCLGTLCAAEDAYTQTVQYFPQLAEGGGYVTTWYFTGLGSGSVVTLELFQANGTPLTLATNRGTANIFTFSVDAAGELLIRSQGLPFAVQVGWARVTSSQPIGATEVFQFLFGGQVISQAGVLASDPTAIATLLVSVDGGRGRNTGFALANLALTSNPVTFTLYNQTGTPVATTTRVLAPQTQTAQFVPELPGFASFTSFEGTLGISALSRFSVVGLVLDGLELSTLPTLPGRIQGRTSNTVVVLGVADIYLAGMPAGFTFGSSSAPLNSPVEAGLAVVAGRSIQVSATGTVGGESPNGVTSGFAVGQMLCSGAPNGISTLRGPRHSLIGIFLGPDQPTTPSPPQLDFSGAARDVVRVQPLLKQTFFIGSGRTSQGTVKEYVIPDGATRLFLGELECPVASIQGFVHGQPDDGCAIARARRLCLLRKSVA